MTRGRRLGLAAAILAATFIAYEVLTSFVAYTGDAYVQSDLVSLAPQVTGRIVSVRVADNQEVDPNQFPALKTQSLHSRAQNLAFSETHIFSRAFSSCNCLHWRT